MTHIIVYAFGYLEGYFVSYCPELLSPDVLMIIGAVLAGYATYMLQQGFGTSNASQTVSSV